MRYLGSIYLKMTVKELNQLRSKKYLELIKVQSLRKGYFANKEMDRLENQILQIDAALAWHKQQQKMFE